MTLWTSIVVVRNDLFPDVFKVETVGFADYLHVEYKRKRGAKDNFKILFQGILGLPFTEFKQTIGEACLGWEVDGIMYLVLDI